jgi:LysM repeat protein
LPLQKSNVKSKIAINYTSKEHEVLAKETPYGIAKLYGISLKELNEVNPTLEATGLKNRSNYTSAQASSPEIAVAAKFTETGNLTAEQTTIAVLPKESKYSIARKYGITKN